MTGGLAIRGRASTALSATRDPWACAGATASVAIAMIAIDGLYRPDVIHRLGPWKGLKDLEYATLEWLAWYKSKRLMELPGYITPAEYGDQLHRVRTGLPVPALN